MLQSDLFLKKLFKGCQICKGRMHSLGNYQAILQGFPEGQVREKSMLNSIGMTHLPTMLFCLLVEKELGENMKSKRTK